MWPRKLQYSQSGNQGITAIGGKTHKPRFDFLGFKYAHHERYSISYRDKTKEPPQPYTRDYFFHLIPDRIDQSDQTAGCL